MGGEPVTDFGAFEVDGEDLVAAAREDDDGGAGVVCGGWGVDGEGGVGDGVDVGPGAAGDEVFAASDADGFGWPVTGRASGMGPGQRGSWVWPEEGCQGCWAMRG